MSNRPSPLKPKEPKPPPPNEIRIRMAGGRADVQTPYDPLQTAMIFLQCAQGAIGAKQQSESMIIGTGQPLAAAPPPPKPDGGATDA